LCRLRTHLARKKYDDISENDLLRNLRYEDCLLVPDYGEKILPFKNVEKQSDHFAKTGMTMWGSTAYLRASVGTNAIVEAMDKPDPIREGDLLANFYSFFGNDSKQNWIPCSVCTRLLIWCSDSTLT
jgi:hypothetical protein